jgi:hypothetical protein
MNEFTDKNEKAFLGAFPISVEPDWKLKSCLADMVILKELIP